MADPAWIVTARSLVGKITDGQSILPLAAKVGELYPDMKAYFKLVNPDTAWCGLFVSYCLAVNGIRPQYIADSSDTNDGLWAQSWKKFGTAVLTPQVGDILVFARHVTFYVGQDDGHYLCLGGNQSDAVTIARYPKDSCEAIRRPPVITSVASKATAAAKATAVNEDAFERCLAVTLRWEGGNDDDPRDPGGRTSRGILQSEWDAWRQSRSGLPQDVWDAPQAQIEAIYRQRYWDRMLCGQMPAGVDLAVFDFGVNSGGGVKVVQRVVGTDPDSEVGPLTLAAIDAVPAGQLIDRICDARMAYLQGLAIWPTFGRGWTNRVNDVRAKAHTMISEELPVPKADPSPLPQTVPSAPSANALSDVLKAIAPVLLEQARAEMAKPETQAAVRGAVSTLLPRLLGALGMSVPGVGIVVAVAGWVLPLLMSHTVGPDTGQALLVSGVGLTSIPIVSKILGLLDRFGAQK
jgi:uncharacterized protein (TIGR02594 family)